MKRLHFFSGLTLSIFIALHLFNHLISIFGVAAHINFMEQLRLVYRHPIIEILLLVSVLIQIITGVKFFFSKRKGVDGFYQKLQIWSGLYMAVFFLIHVGAVMGGRYILELDTNVYFGAAGLNTFPFNLFFIPYYGLAILAFFGHLSAIHYQKMKRTIVGVSVKQQSLFMLITGIILTLAIFYGLTNGFGGMEFPVEYDVLVGK